MSKYIVTTVLGLCLAIPGYAQSETEKPGDQAGAQRQQGQRQQGQRQQGQRQQGQRQQGQRQQGQRQQGQRQQGQRQQARGQQGGRQQGRGQQGGPSGPNDAPIVVKVAGALGAALRRNNGNIDLAVKDLEEKLKQNPEGIS